MKSTVPKVDAKLNSTTLLLNEFLVRFFEHLVPDTLASKFAKVLTCPKKISHQKFNDFEFAINVQFFAAFSMDLKSVSNSAFFKSIFFNKTFRVILVVFEHFVAKRARRGKYHIFKVIFSIPFSCIDH